MFKKPLLILFVLVLLGVSGYVGTVYYSQIFAKDVQGKILKVERLTQQGAVISTNAAVPEKVYFSFAVAVQDSKDGHIYAAATEDTRWAVVTEGKCADARFFPYPPWHMEKRGTFFGAQLIQMFDCK